ncbi:MAG: HPr family phosphocarrier protein [Gammaproteobacteria bacterium]
MNALGVHTRPAATLVGTARGFDSEIRLAANGRSADAKSIVGILSLAAGQGTTVELRARGPDAADALRALRAIIESGFDE